MARHFQKGHSLLIKMRLPVPLTAWAGSAGSTAAVGGAVPFTMTAAVGVCGVEGAGWITDTLFAALKNCRC